MTTVDTEHDRYRKAFNLAVDRANQYGKVMQLRREVEYGRVVFNVNFAVGDPAKRFGVDARGEFIEPGTPKMNAQLIAEDNQ